MIKATKLTIVYQVPFEMWSQEKVYAKIEQCVHIKSWLNAKYFAMHCWNLNSLQKGLKTALNITVSGNVDFSFSVKMKGTNSKTADQLDFFFGNENAQYLLKIPREDIDNDFDPVKNNQAKISIVGEEGKAELERLILAHDNKKITIITSFKDGKEINLKELRTLTLPDGKVLTSDIKGNLGTFINNEQTVNCDQLLNT